jgi:hypothetical protein
MPISSITASEIIDIFLVAILIYKSIVLLRQTQAAFVVRGMLMFGAMYLDLQMTTVQGGGSRLVSEEDSSHQSHGS